MQQRPPFPNIWKGPQGCLQHSRGRKECPPQGIVSSLASGPSRESPRSSIPVSWWARMDGPTPLSPFSESTRGSRVLIAQKYWTHQEKSFLGKGSQHQQIQFGSNSGGVVKTYGMYKGHVVFLGRGAVTSNRFWNGFVTDLLPRDTGIPRNSAKEKLRGTSFQEIDFIFSVNSSLKILQKKLLRRPNRDVDASKTSPATCFFFF